MKRLLAFLFVIAASFAEAQTGGTRAVGVGAGGGSALAAGDAVSGCTIDSIVYIDASGNLACDGLPGYDGTTTTLDNGAVAASILVAKDNGTAVFTIADGGGITATSTLALTGRATLTGGFEMASGVGGYLGPSAYPAQNFLGHSTANTPDASYLATGTTSVSFHLIDTNDISFDFNNGPCGVSACTDPTLIVHSAAQDTTQYNAQAVWGSAGGSIKTLTESSATPVVRIPVTALTGTGGSLRYTIFAADATDVQIREGEIKFAVVNKAATETCTLSAASEAADGSVAAVSAGTLTYAITCDTSPTNAVDISFNAVSSLTQTTLQATYSVALIGPGQPARQ